MFGVPLTGSLVHRACASVARSQTRGFSASASALAKEKLVILGSGWAGYRLLNDVDKKRYDVTVISDRPDFTFTPLLASASVGTLEYRATLESVHQFASKATYHQAWAENVNFQSQNITCTPAVRGHDETDRTSRPTFSVPYDKLVIAVGAYSQTFGIPGVKENATFLKTVADAQRIRNRIYECFEEANLPSTSMEEKKRLLTTCAIGGGPTSIEFAAELHDLITTDIARAFPHIHHLARIIVFETSDRVLSAFDENLGDYASKQFERDGISIKTSHTVKNVTPTTIETEQEAPQPYGLCVWSTGLAPNPLVKSLEGVKKHEKTSSLLTDSHCQVLTEQGNESMKNVYGIGDAAIVDGLLLPATAQVADQKAKYMATKLNALARGKPAEEPFHFKDRGVMAYIGGWRAILQTPEPGEGNFHISGRAAWLLWRSAYFAKTLSVRNKLLVAWFWFFNWVFSRSLSKY